MLDLLLLTATLGFSAYASPDSLTVREAINMAQSFNPDIRSLRNQFQSTEAHASQSLAPSEPQFSITYNDLDKAFNVPNSASTLYQISQPLGFPGKAFVNKSNLDHQAKSLLFQLRAKELDVANTVKTAYYNLALAQENIRLNTETKTSYERILAIAKRRYEAGSITQVDLLNAELALYANSNDLADLQTTETTTRGQLNAFLNRSIQAPIQVDPIPMPAPLEKRPILSFERAEEKMAENRPELNSMRELSEASSKSYTAAKMSLLPDFQLTAGMTTYNFGPASPTFTGNGATQTYMVGVQMTIPLWGLFNEREAIVAASHDFAAAEANFASLTLQSRTALQQATENLKALRAKINNYQDHLLALSEQAFKLALVSYSSGKIDFQTLADTATARRQIRHDYYNYIVNYMTSYSAYGQLLGEDYQ